MAYVKTDWMTGDVITAEKLNHAEDGISQVDFDQAEMDERLSAAVTELATGQEDMDERLSAAVTELATGQEEMDERLSGAVAELESKSYCQVVDFSLDANYTLYPPTSETAPSSQATGRVEYNLPDDLKDTWKIAGIVKYEVKNGNTRINAIPVFMFSLNSQSTIRVGFVSPTASATRIDMAILLVRR